MEYDDLVKLYEEFDSYYLFHDDYEFDENVIPQYKDILIMIKIAYLVSEYDSKAYTYYISDGSIGLAAFKKGNNEYFLNILAKDGRIKIEFEKLSNNEIKIITDFSCLDLEFESDFIDDVIKEFYENNINHFANEG